MLRSVTEQIKSDTQEQRQGNKEIFDSLNAIDMDSATFTVAIRAQSEQSQVIISETESIIQAVKDNIAISESLLGLINYFHFDKSAEYDLDQGIMNIND